MFKVEFIFDVFNSAVTLLFDHAKEYALERVQFDMPVAFQQVNQFKFADMAIKLTNARNLVYAAAEKKQAHVPYGLDSAMAKTYASDVAVEICNDALQLHGGNGFLKGMEAERAYRDAKITTIYEGTNEIQRVVIASQILGKAPKTTVASSKDKGPITGNRKKEIYAKGSPQERVDKLVKALKANGYDFSIGIDPMTPIADKLVICQRLFNGFI